jgi:glycosyltransferase involved in cell wall biosynthesis
LRILCWLSSSWPGIGGIQNLTAALVPELMRRGHHTLVVAPLEDDGQPPAESYLGAEVRRFPFWRALRTRDPARIAEVQSQVVRLCRKYQPDLIHSTSVGHAGLFLLAARAGPPVVPLLVALHGCWPEEGAPMARRMLAAADRIVVCSRALLERAARLAPDRRERISLVPNGWPEPELAPALLPFDPPTVLYAGRLAPEKGVDLAVTAFELLARRRPSVRFRIAGDGPERAALEARCTASGLAVDFSGWVAPDRMPSTINGATVVIIPSRSEGMPLLALQAGWMARPVVAARVGGLAEVIVDRGTGLLVEPEDASALAAAVDRLLDDPAGAVRLGAAARERNRTHYGWGRYVDSYEALYRRLLDRPSAAASRT